MNYQLATRVQVGNEELQGVVAEALGDMCKCILSNTRRIQLIGMKKWCHALREMRVSEFSFIFSIAMHNHYLNYISRCQGEWKRGIAGREGVRELTVGKVEYL